MQKYNRIRLFKSDFLERFTVVHPSIPIIIYSPVLLYCLSQMRLTTMSFFTVFLGVFCWSFTEYMLHRFIFHLPINTVWAEKLRYLIHEIHHKDPRDPLRLVAPPIMSLSIGLILLALFSNLLSPDTLYSFVFGFTLSYLCYDYLHWTIHHSKMRNKLIYRIRRNHALHHHSNPPRRFGVTTPFWDHIFNTYTIK